MDMSNTETTTTTTAATGWAEDRAEAPFSISEPHDIEIRLIDGPLVLRDAVTIRDAFGMTYHVEDISGRVSPNEMSNYRPDPEKPGFWTWDEVRYPAGTFRVFSFGECLEHFVADLSTEAE